MSVKWIKIVTDIFDDEKILLIESMPDADKIIVIWFKLLCLAGKTNNGGVLMLNERIHYTDEMLATIFRRPVNTVRMALKVFEDFGMIEIINNVITIPNWSKHQTLDKLEERKEYMRKYMQKYREKQRRIASGECKVNSKVYSKVNVSDPEVEEELDIDKEEEEDNILSTSPAPPKPAQPMKPVEVIFNHWNSKGIIKHRKITDKLKRAINNALKDYSQDEICTAIDNYAIILADDKYYWTYKWGLGEFISRGLDKFLDFEVAANNYMKDKSRTEPQSWDKLRRLYQKYEAEENLERSSYL